ncbi:MAG: peptidoglycan-binding protein [Anaerovoracaceae bacterium]
MSIFYKDNVIQGEPSYVIYLDDVRIDHLVKDYSTSLSVDGQIGSATINMIYVPNLDKILKVLDKDSSSGGGSTTVTKPNVSGGSTTTTTTKKDYNIDKWPAIMKSGSKGSSVKDLQTWLWDLGYKEIRWFDGIFGNRTLKCVREFQRASKIKVDGIVGKDTKAAFRKKIVTKTIATKSTSTAKKDYNFSKWPANMKRGNKGTSVGDLQRLLVDIGRKEVGKVDSVFGSKTHNAVTNFQKSKNLKTDGIVGKNTKAALQKAVGSSGGGSSTSKPTKPNANKVDPIYKLGEDGIEDMTVVRIYEKNMITNKFMPVFEGNLRRKSITISGGVRTLSLSAVDYMNWLNRTICPIALPLDDTLAPGDRLRWKAQGIDLKQVGTVKSAADINFKGKNVKQMWDTITKQTLKCNSLYNTTDSVSLFDNVMSRTAIMGDIDETLRKAQVMDFMLTTSATSASSIYVLMNEVFKTLMFEFFQTGDGIIRIKPPFWNETVLASHVIDPSLIVNFTGSTDWENRFTRIITTGGLEDWQRPDNNDTLTTAIMTPVVVATSSGLTANSGAVSITSNGGGSGGSGEGTGGSAVVGDSNWELGNQILSYGKTFFGKPYVWGGTGPRGYDCSGYTQAVYKKFGYSIPRVSGDQISAGVSVKGQKYQPGDLLCWKKGVGGRKVGHVALYSRPGFMYEAQKTGTNIGEYPIRNTPHDVRRIIGHSKVNGGYVSAGVTHGGSAMSGTQAPGPDTLLQLTDDERKYGPKTMDITQPLIKFSTAPGVNNSSSAYDALTRYSKFMLNYSNSGMSVASLTTVAMPWIKPGFNIWVDPLGINMVYYVSGISHQGSAANGSYTSFNLTMGRPLEEFRKNKSPIGGLKPGKSDDVFINTFYASPKDFGTPCNYDRVAEKCKQFYTSTTSVGESGNRYEFAEYSGWMKYLYLESPPGSSATVGGSKPTGGNSSGSGGSSSGKINIDKWPKIIKRGNKGNHVKELQTVLKEIGHSEVGKIDGVFGSKTHSAVKSFQRKSKLRQIDGIVGNDTKTALKKSYGSSKPSSKSSKSSGGSSKYYTAGWKAILKSGIKGNDVKEYQMYLSKLGYSEVGKADGAFGNKTKLATTKFQKKSKLKADGIAGANTQTALESALKSKNIDKIKGVTVEANKPSSSGGSSKPQTADSMKTSTGPGVTKYSRYGMTLRDIQGHVGAKYKSAPNVIKRRKNRLKELIDDATKDMSMLYYNDIN